jgi:hypothetical protein
MDLCDADYCLCRDGLSAALMIEHLRRKHGLKSKIRPANNGCDAYGHEWYCFGCPKDFKDHRSFNSDASVMQHIYDRVHADIEKWKKMK